MTARLSMLLAVTCLLAPPLAAQASPSRIIHCGTDSRQRVQCDAGVPVARARLVRDSTNRCGAPGTWGWTDRTVWTDNGCRGEFEVNYVAEKGRTKRMTCGTLTTKQAKCATEGLAASVRLIRLGLFARCTQGSNWGYSDSLIWAGKGCRAEFEVTYKPPAALPAPRPERATKVIPCGNVSGRIDTCRTEGQAASVRLVKELSNQRCRRGTTWDYNATLLWAKDGCRGAFEVTYQAAAQTSADTRRITCGNVSNAHVQCAIGGDATGVRLVRDLSGGRCRRGSSWDHTAAFIWANQGCRAEFEVTRRGGVTPRPTPTPSPAPAPTTRVITCGNAGGAAMSCNAFGTVATVSLKRDRSGGACGQSSSWGLAEESIWVARKCHGDFEVTYGAVMRQF